MRIGRLAAAGWVVAATLTLGVSWSAVQVVRGAVAPENPAVTDGLPAPNETTGPAPTSATPTGAAPTRSPSARPSATAQPAGAPVTATGVGGTAIVECVGGVPRFVSRFPRQGFSVDVDDSPGEVRFESEDHRTDMKASCSGTKPVIQVYEDDRAGNSGPGGGGGDNSGTGGGGG